MVLPFIINYIGRTSKIQLLIQNNQQILKKKNASKSQPADSRKPHSKIETNTIVAGDMLKTKYYDTINPVDAQDHILSRKHNVKMQLMSSKHSNGEGSGRGTPSTSPVKYNFKIRQIGPGSIQRPITYQVDNDSKAGSILTSEYESKPNDQITIGEKFRLNSQKFK